MMGSPPLDGLAAYRSAAAVLPPALALAMTAPNSEEEAEDEAEFLERLEASPPAMRAEDGAASDEASSSREPPIASPCCLLAVRRRFFEPGEARAQEADDGGVCDVQPAAGALPSAEASCLELRAAGRCPGPVQDDDGEEGGERGGEDGKDRRLGSSP
jgi:hypothetical protein